MPTAPSSTSAPEIPSPTPIELATPSPAVTPAPTPGATSPGATPFEGCINGWISPDPAADEYTDGLEILSGYMGVTGPWAVDEMRYFVGPDSPGVIEPFFENVERWYIRGSLESDPGFRGRFLLEKRTDQILGVSAVAAYESTGYQSPDWTGFIGEGPPTTYLDLPGQWSGIPFDFVTGENDGGMPGLPPEVVDCLAGT